MDTLIWGGTGQAKVIRPIIEHDGHRLIAVYDRNPRIDPPFFDIPLITGMVDLEELFQDQAGEAIAFAVAIGGHGTDRVEVGETLCERGFKPLTLVHDRAWTAKSAQIAEGCQILGMAAVSEEVRLGRFCIINTNASVDHECRLGDGVHVMPGATVAGCVEIGNSSTIGSNATVLPRIRIGQRAMVAAGAIVTHDVPDDALVIGQPARLRSVETSTIDAK